ncbi:AraC family transcriptional regulator [Paenibacillus flagellatus]|nr:AraC family transcriptional regulator [Paenibacillus flagellatus]
MLPSDSVLYALKQVQGVRLDAAENMYGTYADAHIYAIVSEGSGYLYCGGSRCRLKGKTVVYCPPGSTIDARTDSAGLLDLFWVRFEVWELAEDGPCKRTYVKKLDPIAPSGIVPSAVSDAAQTSAGQLARLWERGGEGNGLRLEAEFALWLHYVLRQPKPAPEDEPDGRIQYAIDYVERHYREPVTRAELAERVGLTPEYFSAAFKKATGSGFLDYLSKIRIARAKEELLLRPGRSLDRIAHDVGYRDGLYLSRKFKQVVGVPPSVYANRPKRIVALQYVGHLLALGVTPVATTAKLLQGVPYRDRLRGVADIGTPRSLDRIAALQPDMILTSSPNGEPYSRIAPTVSIPWGEADVLDELRYLGQLLGREKEAQVWIDAFAEKEEAAARRLSAVIGPGETAAVYEIWAGRIWAVNIGYGRGVRNLYKTLGFAPPEKLAPYVLNPGVGLELSPDELEAYAPDRIFVTVWNERGGEQWAREVLSSEPWMAQPAVRNGNVYPVDLELFKHGDPLALELQLEVQTRLLTKVHGTSHIRK